MTEFQAKGRLLNRDAPGFEVLLQCLAQGQSILSRHDAQAPIVARAGAPQMLFAQSAGTSGAPKTIRRSPQSWIVSFEVNRDQFGLGPHDTYAVLGQLGHSLALYAALEALHLGAGLLSLAGQRAPDLAGVSVLYATPAQLRLLLAASSGVVPGLRHVFCGGGALDAALLQALVQRFPNARIRAFYGATETSFITMADADTPPGSVGRAYPGVELRLDAEGEIWVQSPYLFDGYDSGDSPHTRRDGDWLAIGELGRLQDGYLFLHGRRSRMVTVADSNVYPEAIEQVLGNVPGVRGCVAVARPDAMRGHAISCFVVGDVAERLLRDTCRAALGAASVPRRFVFVDQIPLLPAGKPDIRALEARL